MLDNKCKICRRLGVKLFLKGEKCMSPKCPMTRKPYPPGQKNKKRQRRRSSFSEYAQELREKQKLKYWYGLSEKQLRNYVKKILAKKGKVEDGPGLLIEMLESRFDNVIFRLGFAVSRIQARQLVSHSNFLVNQKPTNIPSRQIKKGDVISWKPQKTKKIIFQNLEKTLKKYKTPSWLKLDTIKLEAKVLDKPALDQAQPPVAISAIFEYYSR